MCEADAVHRSAWPGIGAGEEVDVDRGIVDVFAFQEALLIEAVIAVVILAMIWVGFRRWLQHKERMGRLIADQTAQIERVEERLKAIEQIAGDGGTEVLPDVSPKPVE
jgi:hypothetical protein